MYSLRTKYYKITGLDEGVPIEPYYVESNSVDIHSIVSCYGDCSREYEEISKKEYLKNIKGK